VAELAEHLRLYGDHPEYVFSGRDGGPLRKTWVRRHFRPATERAGLAPLRPHHLRHTAVSMLIGQGAHPKEIQEWCGHGSFAITMDVYGHLLPERHEKLAALLDGVHQDRAKPADVVPLDPRERSGGLA
jgi:integrase